MASNGGLVRGSGWCNGSLVAARRTQYGEGINRYILRSSDSGKQMWVWVE